MRIRTRRARADDRAAVWALYEAALRGHIEAIWGWDDGWQADHFEHAWQVAITCIVERAAGASTSMRKYTSRSPASSCT